MDLFVISRFEYFFPCQAPARVALAVTTLLAMSTTTSSINNSLPPVAYTKAIDVWTNLCVSFVFLALLEYALVNYAARYVSILIIVQYQSSFYSIEDIILGYSKSKYNIEKHCLLYKIYNYKHDYLTTNT